MRVIKVDRKNSFLELVPESLDDLWHLERIIEKGDLVSGSSERKVKGEEGRKAERIKVWVEVEAEKIEFHKPSSQLRVSGEMKSMKPIEFFEAKAHHTVEAMIGGRVKVKKKKLKNYQLERINKAVAAAKKPRMLLVVLDDEAADLAVVREYGFEHKLNLRSGRSGKQFKQEKEKESKYFAELLKKIKELNLEKVIIAGPGFTKNEFRDYLEGKGEKMEAVIEATNSVGVTGLNELVKRGIIDKVVRETLLSEESRKVEEAMIQLSKGNELIEYGRKEVGKAIEAGAVKELLVSDEKLFEERGKAERLMERVEEMGGKVHLISSQHEAGKQLQGMGGLIALLRFKV